MIPKIVSFNGIKGKAIQSNKYNNTTREIPFELKDDDAFLKISNNPYSKDTELKLLVRNPQFEGPSSDPYEENPYFKDLLARNSIHSLIIDKIDKQSRLWVSTGSKLPIEIEKAADTTKITVDKGSELKVDEFEGDQVQVFLKPDANLYVDKPGVFNLSTYKFTNNTMPEEMQIKANGELQIQG